MLPKNKSRKPTMTRHNASQPPNNTERVKLIVKLAAIVLGALRLLKEIAK